MAKKKQIPITPRIKELLGFQVDADDGEVLSKWKKASKRVCKPCWELKYCPYGPLVEDFPLLPPLRAAAEEHNQYLRQLLRSKAFDDGTPVDAERLANFEAMVAAFDPGDYPESIPEEIAEMSCRVFGHICPVVFTAEDVTETNRLRRTGRNIPPSILMRVARRDNYICQICGAILRDDEIEFDHIIPVAKGGSSEEHNLRVSCFECNRKKSSTVDL
jgi:hypothetical protein